MHPFIQSTLRHSQDLRYALEPLWRTRRFETSTNVRYHLPNIGEDIKMTLGTVDYSQAVYSFLSKQYSQPIDEILLVRFPQQWVSVVAYARAGVYEQLTAAVDTADVGPYAKMHKHMGDHRKRVALTVELQKPFDRERMQRFIQVLKSANPFSPFMQGIFDVIFTQDDKMLYSMNSTIARDNGDYPPYLRLTKNIWCIGEDPRFYPHRDKVIPKNKSALFEAILQSRIEEVKHLLAENPACVMQSDPWGLEPTELAVRTQQEEILKLLVEKREQYVEHNNSEQHNYRQMIRQKLLIDENYLKNIEEKTAEYEKLSRCESPTRSRLQEACIHGDFDSVKSEVLNDGLLEECDPLGFKPLFLAVANGHYEISKWLLEQGAATTSYLHKHAIRGYRKFKLIFLVDSPEMMRLVLFYHSDPEDAFRRLMEFLENKDYAMIEVLLYYLRDINTRSNGLSPWDYVIEQTDGETQRRLMELLTAYWDDRVPNGPYDSHLSIEIQTILTEHNKKQYERETRPRPKIHRVVAGDRNVQTQLLSSKGESIILDTKRVSTLTDSEKDELKCLFFTAFSMREFDSEHRRTEFFSQYIDHPHDEAFVDVSRHEGKIISFLFFEFLTADQDAFRVFHAQLGCTDKYYQDMGLANLAFRAALIAWSPHQRLLIFGKCVRPGLGFGLFPKFFMGHPTHALDSGILRQVVELTGEKLNSDKSITANSKVDIPTRPKNYKLRKFDYLLPKSPEAATPVAFFLDPETVQQFLGQMEGNGVTYNNLEAFRQNWPLESTVCRCQ